MKSSRTIIVNRQWFEQLEAYLMSDERFIYFTRQDWPLILITPTGMTLNFTPEIEHHGEAHVYFDTIGYGVCSTCGKVLEDHP